MSMIKLAAHNGCEHVLILTDALDTVSVTFQGVKCGNACITLWSEERSSSEFGLKEPCEACESKRSENGINNLDQNDKILSLEKLPLIIKA